MDIFRYLLFAFLMLYQVFLIYGWNDLLVKKLEHCDPNGDYDFVLHNLTFKIIGNNQYCNGMATIKKPLDNTLKSNITVEILTGNRYVHMIDINETKSCDALHKYFGEFAYEIERNVQLIPGMCPIPKGTYYLHNQRLNVEKITTLANFPFGNLRFVDTVYDNSKRLYTCLVLEVEHRM